MTGAVQKPSDLLDSIVGAGRALRPTAVAKKIAATREYKGDGTAQINKWRKGGLGFDKGGTASRRARRIASEAIGRPPDFFEKAYEAWSAANGAAEDAPDIAGSLPMDVDDWQTNVHVYVLSERGKSTPGPVVVKLLQLSAEARRAVGWSNSLDDIHSAREAVEKQLPGSTQLAAPANSQAPRFDRAWTEALERNFSRYGPPDPAVVTALYQASAPHGATELDEAVADAREQFEATIGSSRPAGRSGKAGAKRRHR